MSKRPVKIESGANSDGLRIYIRDEASGVMLAGFTLDTQQVWDVLRGGQASVEALMTEHFDRVGKTMEHESVYYSRDMFGRAKPEQALADAEQLARADRPSWDEYDPRRTNTGSVQVVMRRWV